MDKCNSGIKIVNNIYHTLMHSIERKNELSLLRKGMQGLTVVP
jgi:hypothetical protein